MSTGTTAKSRPDRATIEGLAGHAFPGGTSRIAHWDFFQPLHEETDYRVKGGIVSAARCEEANREYDRIQFQFDVALEDGEPVARSTVTWHYTRNTL